MGRKSLLIWLFCFMTFAFPPAFAQEVKCNEAGTQAEMDRCAYDELDKQDKELNKLYHQKMGILTEDSQERLKAAQTAWLKFRDATCLYEIGPREESGSIWPLLHADCLSKLTKRRVEELRAYVACKAPEDFCPR